MRDRDSATNDIHYINVEDAEPHDVLLCIQTGKKVNDENRMRYTGGQYYLKSEQEMRDLFRYAQQAIDNTAKIADRCNVEIELVKVLFQSFLSRMATHQNSILRSFAVKDWCAVMVRRHHR